MTSLLGSDVVKPLALPPVLHDLFTGPELKGIHMLMIYRYDKRSMSFFDIINLAPE